jgi:hypothetical protein
LAEKYFEIKDPPRVVDRNAAARIWRIDENYASVALHEMRGALLIDRLGRGAYLPVPPEKWVPVHSFLMRARKISTDLCELLQDSMNDIECLALYGSQIWGGDELSDWDFFIVTSSEKSKNTMRTRLLKIKRANFRLDAEILSVRELEIFLRKDPIFLKFVAHECRPIIDTGILGIGKAIEIKPKHVAVELLAAKENLLQGMACARRGESGAAWYWLARGIRRTLAAVLSMRGNFSGRALEEEFRTRFPQYGQLRIICKKVSAEQDIRLPKRFLRELIGRAIVEWELAAKELREWGKSAK